MSEIAGKPVTSSSFNKRRPQSGQIVISENTIAIEDSIAPNTKIYAITRISKSLIINYQALSKTGLSLGQSDLTVVKQSAPQAQLNTTRPQPVPVPWQREKARPHGNLSGPKGARYRRIRIRHRRNRIRHRRIGIRTSRMDIRHCRNDIRQRRIEPRQFRIGIRRCRNGIRQHRIRLRHFRSGSRRCRNGIGNCRNCIRSLRSGEKT